jgi:hypothetical protein
MWHWRVLDVSGKISGSGTGECVALQCRCRQLRGLLLAWHLTLLLLLLLLPGHQQGGCC